MYYMPNAAYLLHAHTARLRFVSQFSHIKVMMNSYSLALTNSAALSIYSRELLAIFNLPMLRSFSSRHLCSNPQTLTSFVPETDNKSIDANKLHARPQTCAASLMHLVRKKLFN